MVSAYRAGQSALSVAREHDLSLGVVLHRLRAVGVSIRRRNRVPPRALGLAGRAAEIFHEIVDGLLLGDGTISASGVLRVDQARRRQVWVREVAEMLRAVGVPCRESTFCTRGSYIGSRQIPPSELVFTYTPAVVETKAQRQRWYREGRRVVPADVRLTPRSVALWFCGNGTYGTNGTLSFMQHGFLAEEMERVAQALQVLLGVKISVYVRPRSGGSGCILATTSRGASVALREFMGPFVSEVFAYKLRYVRPAIPRGHAVRRLSATAIREIRRRHARGALNVVLAKDFLVSGTTIGKIVRGLIYRDVT